MMITQQEVLDWLERKGLIKSQDIGKAIRLTKITAPHTFTFYLRFGIIFVLSLFLFLIPLYYSLVLFSGILPFFIYTVGLVILTSVMFVMHKKTFFWDPIAYSSLFVVIIAVSVFSYFHIVLSRYEIKFTIPFVDILLAFNALLAATLILLIIKYAGGFRHFLKLDVIFACYCVLSIASVGLPDLLLALNLLVLGYGQHLKFIIGLGFIILIAFLITLFGQLHQAIGSYMIGTGFMLLLIYFVLDRIHSHVALQKKR